MLKTLALVSVLTSAAFAQSSTTGTATPSPSANPLIPSGISQSCATYLNALNTDSTMKTCLTALNTATSPFAPGSTVSPTSATVTNALNALCADSVASACPEATIRTQVTNFFSACPAELNDKVPGVITLYDTMYTMGPMRTAVCSKDDSGSWCAMSSAVSSREVGEGVAGSSMDLAHLLALLYTNNGAALKRRAEVPAIVPNMTTFHDTNLPFLFFKPDLDATKLCTTCARNVLTAYINFESNCPYAPGLGNSQLLDTQAALYNAVKDKCPDNFLTGALQAAGGLSSGFGSRSAAVSKATSGFTTLAAGTVALVAVFFSL